MNVFVDTQLWVYAFKRPIKEGFANVDEYEKAVKMHNRGSEFTQDMLANHITTH